MKSFFYLAIFLLASSESFARTVARVSFVEGNAFVFGSSGKSMSLGFGSKIGDLAEVMVEDGSSLTLVNNSDDKIHITGGSLVKFFNGSIELKNGKLWVDSNSNVGHIVHTSNSVATYNKGQFIYSYDNVDGKSQLLVLEGDVGFSNALEPDLKIQVPSGFFTFVEQNYENGLPRAATKVGLNSYKNMRASFANFNTLRKNDFDKVGVEVKKVKREIASVPIEPSFGRIKKGKIIQIRTVENPQRVPASVEQSPLSYFKEIKKQTKRKHAPKKTGQVAKIKIYGKPAAKIVKSAKLTIRPVDLKRAPASVGSSQIVKELKSTPTSFEKSLKTNLNKNQKHSTEVNHLIDELNSYKKDFDKKY